MAVDDHNHNHGAEAATNERHENSWSVNLEKPKHATNQERIREEAQRAIERTASGYHVNLVTHGDHGHPETYLYDALDAAYGDQVTWEHIEQCGCGHVVRVHV